MNAPKVAERSALNPPFTRGSFALVGGRDGRCGRRSGTIASVFPSTPRDSDAWDDDVTGKIAQTAQGRSGESFYAGDRPGEETDDDPGEELEEIRVAPVRRQLSVAIAGFSALLGAGLVFGVQTSGPDERLPFAIVVLGVQCLYVLAFTMAIRPPAAGIVAGVTVATAVVADYLAVTSRPAGITPLLLTFAGGFLLCLVGQAVRRESRLQLRDSLGGTFVIIVGVVLLAMLLVLTRLPVGSQAVVVGLTSVCAALTIAHLADAVFPKPRIALQVPRGATGVILGAMLGTFAAAGFGSVLVYPFTPANGAVLGLIAAFVGALIDLAVNYSEAGRSMAGDKPTLWVARHMQGPLGAFAFVVPVTYVMAALYLT